MSLTGGFRPGDVVRMRRRSLRYTPGKARPWEGKVIAISPDGQTLALVDLGLSETVAMAMGDELPPGCYVVRALCADEVYLVRKAGK